LPMAHGGGVADRPPKFLLLKQALVNIKFLDSCMVLDAYLLLLETGCASMQSGNLSAITQNLGDKSSFAFTDGGNKDCRENRIS
jgi:hypothetical protein